MYVVIRQLLLLRDEFRIPKLTFQSHLLHSTLEKNPTFHAKTLRSEHRARPTNSKKCAERQWALPPVFITLILSPLLTRLLCRLTTNSPRRQPIAARCTAVGLLPLLREEFRLLKLIFHSDLLHSTLEKNPTFHAKTLRSEHRARPTNSKKWAERGGARPSNGRRHLSLYRSY